MSKDYLKDILGRYLGRAGLEPGSVGKSNKQRYALWTDIFYSPGIIQSETETVAALLGREIKIVEGDWKSEIDCGAIHPDRDWFAWKEYRERYTRDERGWVVCNYYLHIVVDGQETLNWAIKTYNPFFGCGCHYMMWHDERLVMIYHEKHRFYGVSCSLSKVENVVDLGPIATEGALRGNTLFAYFPYPFEGDPVVCRFSMPDLVELESLTIQQALSERILVNRVA